MVPTLIGITFGTFAVMQLAPGDPAEIKFAGAMGAGDSATDTGNLEAAIAKFRRQYLLDQPLWKQYVHSAAERGRQDRATPQDRAPVDRGQAPARPRNLPRDHAKHPVHPGHRRSTREL